MLNIFKCKILIVCLLSPLQNWYQCGAIWKGTPNLKFVVKLIFNGLSSLLQSKSMYSARKPPTKYIQKHIKHFVLPKMIYLKKFTEAYEVIFKKKIEKPANIFYWMK